MDFAKKLLEKYGWTAGKGLGRNEDGIREALKATLKRSTTGLGHDTATEFTDHWWNKLYDKASGNIEVTKSSNGSVRRMKVKDPEAVEITNRTWSIKKRGSDKVAGHVEGNGYVEHFVKKSVLMNGGSVTKPIPGSSSSSSSEEEDSGPAKMFKPMTDEELFAACGGRTAHKGARHGLRATGKLARIQEQEAKLLKLAKFKGYSQHCEDSNFRDDELPTITDVETALSDTNHLESVKIKKRKKKSKKENSSKDRSELEVNDNKDSINNVHEMNITETVRENCKKRKLRSKPTLDNEEVNDAMQPNNMVSINNEEKSKKKKSRKKNNDDSLVQPADSLNVLDISKISKKRKNKITPNTENEIDEATKNGIEHSRLDSHSLLSGDNIRQYEDIQKVDRQLKKKKQKSVAK